MGTQVAPLPTPPTGFGLDNIPANGPAFGPEGQWGPMYNDALLTCVEAAFIHSIMYWTHAATGVMAPFVEEDARSLYSTLTGYVIGSPATDRGTNDYVALNHWMHEGINDDNGVNHKLLAYYQIPTGDVDALAAAAYLCGAVYVGVALPVAWAQTLLHSAIWDKITSPAMTGNGHTFPVFGRSVNGNFITTSYGGVIQMTPAGYRQFSGAAFALISEDYVDGSGRTPQGYTIPQITQYLEAMKVRGFTTANFTGTGTLSAIVVKTEHLTPAFTGTGTLSATVVRTEYLTPAFAGSGTLSATVGVTSDSTTGAFTGAGTLAAAVGAGVSAALTGAGTLTAAATKTSDSTTAALTGTGTLSAAVYSDPSWASVVALLHLDGANGSTTFTDSSPLASNFTIINSTPTISTTQSKFGSASLNLPGGSAQLGASAASSNFAFGTADFTIEFWVYGTSFSGIQSMYDQRPAGGSGLTPTIYLNAGVPTYLTNGVNRITAGSAISTSAWHHIALSRVSGNTKLFVDGTQAGSTYVDANNYINNTGRPYLGNSNAASSGYTGFIDEVRVTKGVGRYSANFTPTTTAFPNG